MERVNDMALIASTALVFSNSFRCSDNALALETAGLLALVRPRECLAVWALLGSPMARSVAMAPRASMSRARRRKARGAALAVAPIDAEGTEIWAVFGRP